MLNIQGVLHFSLPVSDLDREDSIDPDHDMHQLLRAAIGSAAPRMRSAFSAGIKTSYGK